jgi:hypothetical protein
MAPSQARPARAPVSRVQITVGLVSMFVGAVVLLDREGVARAYLPQQLWPFVLIIAGVVRLTAPAPDAGHRCSRRPGLGFLIVGCWGAINELHAFGFDYDTSWPLLVIAAGMVIIWRAFDVAPPRVHRQE